MIRAHRVAVLCALAAALSCRPSASSEPAAPAAVPTATPTPASEPDTRPLPTLRTGPTPVVQGPALPVKVRAQAKHDGATYVELALREDDRRPDLATFEVAGGWVVAEGLDAQTVMVRFAGAVPDAIEGVVHGFDLSVPGATRRFRSTFRIELGTPPRDGSLPGRWLDAASTMLWDAAPYSMWRRPSHPWYTFAGGRLRALAGVKGSESDLGSPFEPREILATLMSTTTPAASLQETLQYDRGLRMRKRAGRATVPIAEVRAPRLRAHPFDRMRAALPGRDRATAEPLAKATPADFWYVRFDDVRDLLRLLGEAEAWLTPVAHVLDRRAASQDLSTRYQTQLGLRRGGLAETMGHTVVSRLAVVGSDPYLREGSDVTFIFEVTGHAAFEVELARHLAAYEAEIPGIAEQKLEHHGHTITVHRDPELRVRRHRARVGDLHVVSNSQAAMRRVLDAIDGRADRLFDEPDLGYMLARDPGQHDVFAFVGDRFVASVVGPTQKIGQARRQMALSELLVPGYAALLYGWLQGTAPADVDALLRSKLLTKAELVHGDGSKIDFAPGRAPRSKYGTPGGLTPLIDLDPPTKVTPDERDAYAGFVGSYETYWQTFIDPIAVRMDLGDDGKVQVDARMLPLIEGSAYRSTEDVVGRTRVAVPDVADGLSAVWAVGDESPVRRDLDRLASEMFGRSDLKLGWLGNWVLVGALDRRALVEVHQRLEDEIQLPPEDDKLSDEELWMALGRLPVYAAAEVHNPVALVATLGALRRLADEIAPGSIVWGEHAKHRDRSIVRIGVSPSSPNPDMRRYAEAFAIYYAQTAGTIVVALDEGVIRSVIDRFEAGDLPQEADADRAMQATVQARVVENGPLWTSAVWLLQRMANEQAAAAAEHAAIVLRGQPGVAGDPAALCAVAQAYLGSCPLTPSGGSGFTFEHGLVVDPVHGSPFAPTYPDLPVPGSPIESLARRLLAIRGDVAFDDEPMPEGTGRSLHTRFTLTLHP